MAKTILTCCTYKTFPFNQIFVRGGPLLWVSDSPQRAKVLGCKHPNNSTKHPCPYCKAKQVDNHPTFGDLGNSKYNVQSNARSYGESQEGWKELQCLELNLNEQTKRSQELGMVAPTSISGGDLGRPLFEKMRIDARRHVPVESLHADALVRRLNPAFFLLCPHTFHVLEQLAHSVQRGHFDVRTHELDPPLST